MKVSTILYLTAFALTPLFVSAHGPQVNEDYSKHVFVDSSDHSMPYRMLSPSKIDPGKKYPLVLFLHGAGERGDDNEKIGRAHV